MKTVARRKVNRLFIFYAYGYGKELERVEMVEDAQNKKVSNVTPEKENTMAKEKV